MLNFATPPTSPQPGFRLQTLEVFNWGTFHKQVWKIGPGGANALLTGDIGSGKSTLVDALTTLLVPGNRITYNKAAGAEGKERSALSYVLGEYKNVQSEASGSRKAQYLRDPDKHYSVLLATFADAPTGQVVTLAQVFSVKENRVQRSFVLAQYALSIVGHFGNFGGDINKLRKRLRDTEGVELFDSFTEYSGRFCQCFGILQRDTALDLFFQTVSMKSVGNLTEFVRNQMLGRTDVREQIKAMTGAFSDLRHIHETVKRVRQQIDQLTMLVADRQQYEHRQGQLAHLGACRDGLPTYLAYLKADLLRADLHRHNTQLKTLKHELAELDRQLAGQQREQVRLQIAQQQDKEGQRLEELTRELETLDTERTQRQQEARQYTTLAGRVDLPEATTAAQFFENQQQLPGLLTATDEQHKQLSEQRDGLVQQKGTVEQQLTQVQDELKSLAGRRNKIPREQIDLRQRLLDGLDLTEADLPFAGELLKVADDETDWEGATERRLRGLALTILVAQPLYDRVSAFANERNLRGLLSYQSITANYTQQRRDISALRPSLVNKVEINNKTDFYDWLTDQLLEYHDLTCCETVAEFRREPYAITREGQIKAGRGRHQKDDRFDIHDRSRYVLGWSNLDLVNTLRNKETTIQTSQKALQKQVGDLDAALRQCRNRQETLRDLQQFSTFASLDWWATTRQIEAKTTEKTQLETAASTLAVLRQQLLAVEKQVETVRTTTKNTERKVGETVGLVGRTVTELQEVFSTLKVADEGVIQSLFPTTEEILDTYDTWLALIDEQAIPTDRLTDEVRQTLANLEPATNAADLARVKYLTNTLPGRIAQQTDKAQRESNTLQQSLMKLMGRFCRDFPAESVDFSEKMQDLPLYEAYYDRLRTDDLPRHEARLQQDLQANTIQSVIMFRSKLSGYEEEIAEKISQINEHLRQVDYTPGTYIELTRDRVRGDIAKDIEQFKDDLRACLSDTLGAAYTEAKYEQVRRLLDRFESVADDDQRWTERVTDVRQWYTFGASERWRTDHTEREFYSDSGGKSGGQKEKLAYTVLASAIAYQFGLSRPGLNENRARTFRFVMIDEAFGRGSDESTRHGLDLFGQLNIQLLIVTPLQKINIIEQYIQAVHFVSNETGQASQVRTISKAEFDREKGRAGESGPPV